MDKVMEMGDASGSDKMSNLCHLKDEAHLVNVLKDLFGRNSSNWYEAMDISHNGGCNETQASNRSRPTVEIDIPSYSDFESLPQYGVNMYAYLTPFIIIIGLVGNCVSLKVFMRKSLRRLSACLYLSAISITDSLVLLTYVLLAWLASANGLGKWTGGRTLPLIHVHGACQTFVFFSYLFRFVSVWLIVVFTIERYIAACRPLQRRSICTKSFGRKAIAIVVALGTCLSLFKPVLSGVYDVTRDANSSAPAVKTPAGALIDDEMDDYDYSGQPRGICSRHPDHEHLVLAFELIYGLLITAVPFITIAVFNLLIIHRLIRRDATLKKLKMLFKDCRIRWEFTIILLVVSTCFICLNLPYFVVWLHQFLGTLNPDEDVVKDLVVKHDRRNTLFLTKTVYYLNYCVNFFLYCMTGRYYRGELKAMLLCKKTSPNDQHRGSVYTTATRSTTISANNCAVGKEACHMLLHKQASKEPSNELPMLKEAERGGGGGGGGDEQENCSML